MYRDSAAPEPNSRKCPWPFQGYVIRKGSLAGGRSVQKETVDITNCNYNSSIIQLWLCTQITSNHPRALEEIPRSDRPWSLSFFSIMMKPPLFPSAQPLIMSMNYRRNKINKTSNLNYCCAINCFWLQRWRAHMHGICESVLLYFFSWMSFIFSISSFLVYLQKQHPSWELLALFLFFIFWGCWMKSKEETYLLFLTLGYKP